ncbi:MAG: TIGR02710 family CRISPR-associated protein [Deltaproteobacteria bacterium]|nr:TIGR02710 family CRISPR-associated protein [Deltaproteobacteria bacterium]
MITSSTILVITVGGSHQPIITAIKETHPAHTCFVCSDKDPGTGKPGSNIQILGEGYVIKAHPQDGKPTLPNIPSQTGLASEQFEVVTVEADDLDNAFMTLLASLENLRSRFPQGKLVADYTGGTKSMSAALVLAALEVQGAELQLVTGNRTDLIKVHDGTQYSSLAISDAVRLHRSMAPHLASWGRFAYDEAAAGLDAIPAPPNNSLRHRLFRARDLSRAFAAWDRFDHTEARRLLDSYAPVVAQNLQSHFNTLRSITGDSPRKEPAQLLDLWRNAERRAAQGRFDDAVARIYRLLEWSAQWFLRSRFGIDCSDIPAEKIPAGLPLSAGRDGKIQAPLFSAWEMVGALSTGPFSTFFRDHRENLLGHLKMRNHSILAHGLSPITTTEWKIFSDWCSESFLPVLIEESGIKMPPQLPQDYRWEMTGTAHGR